MLSIGYYLLTLTTETLLDTNTCYLTPEPLQPRQKPDPMAASRNQLPASQKGSLDFLPPLCPRNPHTKTVEPHDDKCFSSHYRLCSGSLLRWLDLFTRFLTLHIPYRS
jgi:hypothetical protein